MSRNGRRDVTVHVPSATAASQAVAIGDVSPEELCQLQAARIRELERELSNQQIAASTFASAIAGLLHNHDVGANGIPEGEHTVVVPREIRERVADAQVMATENPDGDLVVTITERTG